MPVVPWQMEAVMMCVEGGQSSPEERRVCFGIPDRDFPLLYLGPSKPAASEKDFTHMLLMFPFSLPGAWRVLSFISNLVLVHALGVLLASLCSKLGLFRVSQGSTELYPGSDD